MTKEELIVLSDLNREDNIKYISSEAQGIAITLDSDRYAPTLCKLERAYICGRRKSEERIEQLKKRNGELAGQKASLERWFGEAKEIMQKLIANAPDTYSGTNIELQQRKMFSFQDAINKAEQFFEGE